MTVEQKREAEIEAIGISFHEHPLANAWSEMRRLSAVSIGKLDEYAGCGAITVLARVEGTSKSPRAATTYAKISDATAEIETVVEDMVPVGELIVAEVARKMNEPRWRLVKWTRFNRSTTPRRMRIDIKASHDWETLRKLLISTGRGIDRIDIMVDLGEKKARKVLPSCFTINDDLEKALAANPDVIGIKMM
jgi:DNA polymerase-3 subunit alpha